MPIIKACTFAETEVRNRPYQARTYYRFDEETKIAQRKRVLGYLVSEHGARLFRYLGFPGNAWQFERSLVDAVGLKRCRFRGLEASWAILERSVPWMPGEGPTFFGQDMAAGTVYGFRTTYATVLHAYADSWMSLQRHDQIRQQPGQGSCDYKREVQRFHRLYHNNSLVWFDLTSNLCRDTKRSLRWMFSHCDPKVSRVPIVITLLYGREWDGSGGLEQRERMIQACLDANNWREYEPHDRWFYHSTNGGRMATWSGVLKRKSSMYRKR